MACASQGRQARSVLLGTSLRSCARPIPVRCPACKGVPFEMEDPAMSLIRNGYALSTRGGFSGALFSALLVLALFDPGAATAQEVKQIKLSEKHIQSFMGAYNDMVKLYESANPDKPDPKVEAQAEAVAKKNGFASLVEFDDVSFNVSTIMSGIDPQTKKFTEPPEQIKR